MVRDKAQKQKQKAKEMLGISDKRAKEIFEKQADRKQQKKKELQEKEEQETVRTQNPEPETQEPEEEAEEEPEEETEEQEEVELTPCPECGDEFDSERGMKIHKSQKH